MNQREDAAEVKLRPEEQLLINCSLQGELADQARVPIDGDPTFWARVIELAHWHRITGPLFHRLRNSAEAESVPDGEIDHLKGHFTHTAVRTLYIRSEFGRAVSALQAEGIDVMALKGVALLDQLYAEPGMREMSDIDILVRSESADRAQEIIQGLGYEPVGSESVQEQTRQVHRHLPKLHNHDRELSFEVHTHFVASDSPLYFDIDTVWRRARHREIFGSQVLVPSPEHMLLHLCVHFFLDRRFTSSASLRQLADIVRYVEVEGDSFDWDFFVQEVRENGLSGAVFTALSSAESLADLDLPPDVMTALEPAGYSRRLQELFITQRVLRPDTLTATELVPHNSAYTLVAVVKSVLRRIAPTGQYLENRYGHESAGARRMTRLKRLGEVLQRTSSYLFNPRRLWQEVQVDKWLHSLSTDAAIIGRNAGERR